MLSSLTVCMWLLPSSSTCQIKHRNWMSFCGDDLCFVCAYCTDIAIVNVTRESFFLLFVNALNNTSGRKWQWEREREILATACCALKFDDSVTMRILLCRCTFQLKSSILSSAIVRTPRTHTNQQVNVETSCSTKRDCIERIICHNVRLIIAANQIVRQRDNRKLMLDLSQLLNK